MCFIFVGVAVDDVVVVVVVVVHASIKKPALYVQFVFIMCALVKAAASFLFCGLQRSPHCMYNSVSICAR